MLLGEEIMLPKNKITIKLELIYGDNYFYNMFDRQDDSCFLYCLCDPINDEIRYIGITNCIKNRYNSHYSDKAITWKTNWINKLKTNGLKPKVYKLYEIHKYNYKNDEDFYKGVDSIETEVIIMFGKMGYRLTNHEKLINISNGYNYSINGVRKNCKRLYQFDDNFNLVKEWNSLIEATMFFKINKSSIQRSIKDKTKCFGFYFNYENNFYKEIIDYKKRCYIYDFNGKLLYEFESIKKTANSLNINKNGVSGCINGRIPSTNGFIIKTELRADIKYQSNNLKNVNIEQYDLNNTLIFTYEKVSKIMKKYNLTNIEVLNIIRNEINYDNSYFKFKYIGKPKPICPPNHH